MTWVSLFAGLAFIALMVAALVTTRGNVPMRNLTRAVHLYGWAAATEAIVLLVRLAQHAGILWLLLAAATLAMALAAQHFTRQRRNLKADRVQAEAERTVRDWRGGLR